MKHVYLSLLLSLLFIGCGGSDSESFTPGVNTGVHFQGRDCLSCHNVDLQASSHLSIGGTVYKALDSDKNDLNQACSERLHIEFVGGPKTKDANPVNSPGFNGRGNIFALIKDMPISSGSYNMRIVQDDGTVLVTSGTAHSFNTGFDKNNPSDLNNRYSCNTCHQAPPNNKNGAAGLLFANCI